MTQSTMNARIAITGMGVISPYGIGSDILWEKVVAGENGLKPITSFETDHIRCRVGGQLLDFRSEDYLSPRMIRKIDRFSIFALIAAQFALENACLLPDRKKPAWTAWERGGNRVGVCVGNNLGGWQFAERELRNLWQSGPREVSPYMATAWFPAAVQGNLSIQFGIKGVGRTFLSDRASSALALIHAADSLRRDKTDVMLVGGTEAPFSPYAALCYETSGLMSKQAASFSIDAYRPFDEAHDGLVAAEGAAFFVLERAEDARKRGVPVLAELSGWSSTYDGYDAVDPEPAGKRNAAAMAQAMERAGKDVTEIDCVFAAGSAVPQEDVAEARAIRAVFDAHTHNVPVSVPKASFGNMFGAATAIDTAIAIEAMQHNTIPVTMHLQQVAPECELNYVTQKSQSVEHLQTCLVNARGMGGTNAALILEKWSE